MIDPETFNDLQREIQHGVDLERGLLEELLEDMKRLKSGVRRIQPRSATAISLVGTDGGNNKVQFDPFFFQIVRVVDSSENEYCLEVITPNANYQMLEERHIQDGAGVTQLGRLAVALGLERFQDLSPVFKAKLEVRSPSWVQVYREMTEWAVLFDLVETKNFATDTVIVCDGFLRSKMFSGGLFGVFTKKLEDSIQNQYEKNRRRIYVVGIAKHSKFLQRYRLAMAVEGVLRNAFPAYLDVPEDLELKVYKWSEYVTGGSTEESFVAGKMHLVKFGASPYSPVWAVDLLKSQVDEAPQIFGYVLADAVDGFPIPYYPQCLQKAHESAALVDFDMDILQDQISGAIRKQLGAKAPVVDELSLQLVDPAGVRYS